jgi:DHA1 family bicyclomycin/chloramphenicol resistance-like MFS transporter
MASSVQGFVTTIGGGLIGAMIGRFFDGSVTPLAAGYCFASFFAIGCALIAEKGKLFRSVNPPTR